MITERARQLLRSHATAKTAQGDRVGSGTVVAYSDAPQVLIRQEDGTQFWWRADLCTFEPQPDEPPPFGKE